MIGAAELSRSIFGAWMLARFDRSGAALFDNTPDAFWRSFWAAFVVFPAFAVLLLLRSAHVEITVGPFWAFFIQITGYAVGWLAFPYVMFYVARLFGREAFYYRYIAAYNWAVVIQISLMLLVTALTASGAAPQALGFLLTAGAIISILIYQGFIAHILLEVPPIGAFGIVVIDLIISLILQGWTDRLLSGQRVFGG
jgi:hypothetical protein